MLIQKHRPKNFSDVVGSKFAVKVLRSICKNPSNSPRSIILSGSPGIGKTSCSRIFPFYLNCNKFKDKRCNSNCANCPCQSKEAVYEEFNCSFFGNVKNMREISNSVSVSLTEEGVNRVIVFNEVHLASPEAQSNLLDTIEELPKDMFFVFCTKDPSQILPEIISRSIEIEFDGVEEKDMIAFLKKVATAETVSFSEEVYSRIAHRAKNDVRHALNRLQEAIIVGEIDFLEKYVLLEDLIEDVFRLSIEKEFNVDHFNSKVSDLLRNPVQYIRDDFEKFIIAKSEDLYIKKVKCSGKVELLVTEWLKIQKNLKTRGDWNVFFNTMRRYSS